MNSTGHYLRPVRFISQTTGLPVTIHPVHGVTDLSSGETVFRTVDGVQLYAVAREVALCPNLPSQRTFPGT